MGGKGGSAPPPPDYSAVAASSVDVANIQAQTAASQLAWAKDQFAQNKGVTDQVIQNSLSVSAQQVAAAQQQNQYALQQKQFYDATYRPLETEFAKQAQDYASPAFQEQMAGKAGATVAQNFAGQRAAAQQQLEAYGVDPSQTRAQALDTASRVSEAASVSGAENQSRLATQAAGLGLETQAINVGRGYPGAINTTFGTSNASYGTSLAGGNQAVNSGLATTQVGGQTMGTAPQYYAGANAGYSAAGGILNAGYGNQVNAYGVQQQAASSEAAGTGQAIGSIASLAALALFAEKGGRVPAEVSPTHGKAVDDVDAKVTVGEFIIPKDVADYKGSDFFHRLIDKTREQAAQRHMPTSTRSAVAVNSGAPSQFAGGGDVRPRTAMAGGPTYGGGLSAVPAPPMSTQQPQAGPTYGAAVDNDRDAMAVYATTGNGMGAMTQPRYGVAR